MNIRIVLFPILFLIFWIGSCAGCLDANAQGYVSGWEWETNDDEMTGVKRATVRCWSEDYSTAFVIRVDGADQEDWWFIYNPSETIYGMTAVMLFKFDEEDAQTLDVQDIGTGSALDMWTTNWDKYEYEELVWFRGNLVERMKAATRLRVQIRTEHAMHKVDTVNLNGFTWAFDQALKHVGGR